MKVQVICALYCECVNAHMVITIEAGIELFPLEINIILGILENFVPGSEYPLNAVIVCKAKSRLGM